MTALKPAFKDAPHFKNYWAHGNGKALIEWTGAQVGLEHFEQFAPYHYQKDELGDAVLQDVYLKKSYKDATAQMQGWIRNGVSEDAPESVQKLFAELETVPEWVDKELINHGAEFCAFAGADSLIALRDYSLMTGYDYAYLSKPLAVTGALKKGAVKRLGETLDFWINVTRPNALDIHAKGYEYAIKTRMIHCYARHSIQKHVPDWDTATWGTPINMWDMMATNVGFSLMFMDGLRKLGNRISDENLRSVLHLWKYVCYLLGVPEELVSDNPKKMVEDFYIWTSVQPPADEASKNLALALLDESLENPSLKFKISRRVLRNLHLSASIFLLDKEVTKRLEIPAAMAPEWFPKSRVITNKTINKLIDKKLISRKNIVKSGHALQMKVLEDYNKVTQNSNFH